MSPQQPKFLQQLPIHCRCLLMKHVEGVIKKATVMNTRSILAYSVLREEQTIIYGNSERPQAVTSVTHTAWLKELRTSKRYVYYLRKGCIYMM